MVELPPFVRMMLHSKDYQQIGAVMLESIRNGEIDSSKESREAFCKKANCSLQQYYAILKLLMESKLILKEGKKYVLNRYFLVEVTKEWLEYTSDH